MTDTTTTNPLDAFASAKAAAEKAKADLLAELASSIERTKAIKAALGRVRGPNKVKATRAPRKPKNDAPIEK